MRVGSELLKTVAGFRAVITHLISRQRRAGSSREALRIPATAFCVEGSECPSQYDNL